LHELFGLQLFEQQSAPEAQGPPAPRQQRPAPPSPAAWQEPEGNSQQSTAVAQRPVLSEHRQAPASQRAPQHSESLPQACPRSKQHPPSRQMAKLQQPLPVQAEPSGRQHRWNEPQTVPGQQLVPVQAVEAARPSQHCPLAPQVPEQQAAPPSHP
jgi:hypothetical protein